MQRLMPFQGWRLTFFQGVIFAVFVLFGVRMYQIQIVQGPEWQARADENRISQVPLPADRGVIFDRNNQPLAINVPAFNVTVTPADLPDNETQVLDIYNRLSALINVPPTEAAARAAGSTIPSIEKLVTEGRGIAPYRPVVVAQDVERQVAMQIMEEKQTLPGVDAFDSTAAVREYPTGELTSHIIGYMGRIPEDQAKQLIAQGYDPAYDRIGYSGVEAYLETVLAGQRGYTKNEVDVAGQPIAEIERKDSVPGQNVRLTVDIDLQKASEQALRDEIAKLNASKNQIISQTGVVIAMNPKTGEILSLVSWPSYDNTKFARAIDVPYYLNVTSDPLRPLYNQAISSLYPPGSIWKLITSTGVLQEHVIAPDSTLNDPGRLTVANRYAPNDVAAAQTFVCWLKQGHGNLNIVGAIANSCDVYFYQVGGGNPKVSPAVLRDGGLGIDGMDRYATALGIGSVLGIELPGENGGRMPDPDWKRRIYGESWSTGDTYNAAFGQGYVTVTPLQLISAVATIANGGTLFQPTIIHDYLDATGNVSKAFQPHVLRTVNLEKLTPGETITLLPLEDMIMKGPSSLSCLCETTSKYFNQIRCNPNDYTNTVDINPDPYIDDVREYKVSLPQYYQFTDNICDDLRFDPNYTPPFIEGKNLSYIQEGMREAVTVGTAKTTDLPYLEIAGKTGTAEYCDNIARPLGLCIPGQWPAHAWFVGYAPYKDPQIIVIAFVYHGGEGSAVALPVVRQVLEDWVRITNDRGGQTTQTSPQDIGIISSTQAATP